MYSSFEWDNVKEAENWKKHRVWFDEASTALKDPLMVEFLDDSKGDERWVAFGMSIKSRLLVVVYGVTGTEIARLSGGACGLSRKNREDSGTE